MDVLVRFPHGLSEAVQFGIVLRHLHAYRPDWNVDVVSSRGKHSIYRGLCRRTFHDRESRPPEQSYDRVFDIEWPEQDRAYRDVPSTRATRCLVETFGIRPNPALCQYRIAVRDEIKSKAAAYLSQVSEGRKPREGRFPVFLLHYQGNRPGGENDLTPNTAYGLCQAARGEGLVPVILDWDKRSPLPDQRSIFSPTVGSGDIWGAFGSGDAEVLAALIEQSTMLIAIDSGPLYVAGATTTPTLAVWTQRFGGECYDPAGNVMHYVPPNWTESGLAKFPEARNFFQRHYRTHVYQDLAGDLIQAVDSSRRREQPGLIRCGPFWIRKDNVEQDLVIVRDIHAQDAYRTDDLPDGECEQVVVDIGAHIGCFAKRWHEKNPLAKIICVEACPENLEALQANVGQFAEVVHAACTYEAEPVALLNAVRPNCDSTGGSIVVTRSQCEARDAKRKDDPYWRDLRELPTVTLEDLMRRFGFDRIDVLKLDCEGSEYSILGNTPSLDRVRTIIGEYHDRSRWEKFRRKALPNWQYEPFDAGDAEVGLFRYVAAQKAA